MKQEQIISDRHGDDIKQRAERSTDYSSWLVLGAIGTGTFMSALDGSVVNTTLPLITNAFNTTIVASEWIVTIYLLVISGLLLSFGRLGDLHGHKRVYLIGFSIFLAGSLLCGFATSISALIIYRGIQAFGGAMLSANSPAILTKSFPAEKRGQALGLQATMTYLGLTVGPSLGGWLAESFSWRSIFFINVPVCALALYLSIRYIAPDRHSENTERFDLPGAVLFMAGLVALLFGLNQGHAAGWGSPLIITLMTLALLILAGFIAYERRIQFPMLDLSLFARAAFSNATLSAVLNYICVYTITFLMPFYLLEGRSFSPSQTGLVMTAMPIVMAIIAPLSGTISDRIGSRVLTSVGMLLLSIGLFLLSGLGPTSSLPRIIVSFCFTGLGAGIFISPNTSALMGAAPRSRQGIASGILATARNVGMVLGVGLSGAVFTSILDGDHHAESPALFLALKASFIVAATIAIAGFLVSLYRPVNKKMPS